MRGGKGKTVHQNTGSQAWLYVCAHMSEKGRERKRDMLGERDRAGETGRAVEMVRQRETEAERWRGRIYMHLLGTIHPSPFWVQRSTAEIQGLRLWKSLCRQHPLQDTKARLAPQEAEAGKPQRLPRAAAPLQWELPKDGSRGSKYMSYLSGTVKFPHIKHKQNPSLQGGAAPVPIESCCSPFNLVLRCDGYKSQRFGQLCSRKQILQLGKGVRERRGWGGGGGRKKEKS